MEVVCVENCHLNAKKKTEDMHYPLQDFIADFSQFIKTGVEKSKVFCSWNIFLYEPFPVMRDIIRADRERNWELHMSAFQKTMPLSFSFGKVNYERWGFVYYEICLKLKEKHPSVFELSVRGGFVVQHGEKNFSCVGMDQGSEMCYNKPAKRQGGIIGMIRRKEDVVLQGIIKHDIHSMNMLHIRICRLTENDEYVFGHHN